MECLREKRNTCFWRNNLKKKELWEYEGVDRRKTLKRILNIIRSCKVDLFFSQ